MPEVSRTMTSGYYTPEVTKVEFHRKMPREVCWEFQETSTEQVTTLWKIPLTSEDALENAAGNPMGNATENP